MPSIAVACGCCRNHGWVETSHVCYQAFIYVLPQLVTIVPTLRLLSHQLERSLVLAKNYLAVAGCLVTFPKIVKKGHNKNNIFHHVILEKTPLFILFSHIFVYYFSLSTFWFSRAKDLSPSPESPETTITILPLKFQSFFQLSNPLRSFAQQTAQAHMVPGFLFHVMETHEASLGKFMPDPCKIDGLMHFGGVQWGPLGEEKL